MCPLKTLHLSFVKWYKQDIWYFRYEFTVSDFFQPSTIHGRSQKSTHQDLVQDLGRNSCTRCWKNQNKILCWSGPYYVPSLSLWFLRPLCKKWHNNSCAACFFAVLSLLTLSTNLSFRLQHKPKSVKIQSNVTIPFLFCEKQMFNFRSRIPKSENCAVEYKLKEF